MICPKCGSALFTHYQDEHRCHNGHAFYDAPPPETPFADETLVTSICQDCEARDRHVLHGNHSGLCLACRRQRERVRAREKKEKANA